MRKWWRTLRFCALVALPALLGCGGGGGGGASGTDASTKAGLATEISAEVSSSSRPECLEAQPITKQMELTWNETEQCTDLAAPPPQVIYSSTVICPRNGQPDCLATVPFFPCSDNPAQTCGAVGRFLPECGAIEVPDRYQGAAAHEMIHYLLRTNRRNDWADHTGPEWICQ